MSRFLSAHCCYCCYYGRLMCVMQRHLFIVLESGERCASYFLLYAEHNAMAKLLAIRPLHTPCKYRRALQSGGTV